MPVFKEPWKTNDKAFYLMQNGAITLFMNESILQDEIDWLVSNNYEVITMLADSWNNEIDFHNEISEKLNFPGWYGHNLDALNDCLSDIETDKEGIVIVFYDYEKFTAKFPTTAKHILDIFESVSRFLLLFGKRFFCLVQTNDPHFQMNNLGSNSTNWNRKEWESKKRGI